MITPPTTHPAPHWDENKLAHSFLPTDSVHQVPVSLCLSPVECPLLFPILNLWRVAFMCCVLGRWSDFVGIDSASPSPCFSLSLSGLLHPCRAWGLTFDIFSRGVVGSLPVFHWQDRLKEAVRKSRFQWESVLLDFLIRECFCFICYFILHSRCLESRGCHLISLSYLLSRFSA